MVNNFDTLRKKMIEGQVLPHHVGENHLLHAFSRVPRELFVAPDHKALAHMEGYVPQGQGRYLMPIMVLSKILSSAISRDTFLQHWPIHEHPHHQAFSSAPILQERGHGTKEGKAIVIGAGSGYACVVLSHIFKEVMGYEWNDALAKKAAGFMEDHNITSVEIKETTQEKALDIHDKEADFILIEGALSFFPAALKSCLADGGALVSFVDAGLSSSVFPISHVTVLQRNGTHFHEKVLFLTDAPLLFEDGPIFQEKMKKKQ